MTIHAIILGFVLSTFYGTAFHLWQDGGLGRLLFFILMSWVGFWGGHWYSAQHDWHFLKIGPLHVGLATLGSLVFLAIAIFLAKQNSNTIQE